MPTSTFRLSAAAALSVFVVACNGSSATGQANSDMSSSSSSTVSSSASSVQTEMTLTVRWKFTKQPAATEMDAPMTKAQLELSGAVDRVVDLGLFTGEEFVMPGNTEGMGESITSASIWYAGGGDDVVVQQMENGSLVVRRRTVDEEAGFGEPQDIATVELLQGTEVKVVP